MSRLIATVFGVGGPYKGAGTVGSAFALPFAWGLHQLGGPTLFIMATIATAIIGWYATRAYIQDKTDHDPTEVVIDEVVGQWIALWPVSIGAAHVGADILALWPGWVAAFVGFRFFDILKPWPVSIGDRRNDAFGVMLDDVIAGFLAAVLVVLLAGMAHGFLMG